MSTNYTDCLNWIMPDLPMAPATTLVVNAIRDAVIELCERSLIYQQELNQILVLSSTTTTTSVAQVAGDSQITVADATNFSNGSTLTVALNTTALSASPSNPLVWRGHVSGTPVANVITLDGTLPYPVDSGATVTLLVYLYPLTMPSGTALVKGIKAWLNDSPLDPISPDDLDTEFNNTDFGWVGLNWRTDVNLPTRWYIDSGDANVGLLMPSNAVGAMRILAALKPTRASTSFPTWIYERYVETIAHGAKAKIMLIPKKPYTDLKTGAWHLEQFNGLVGEARIRQARGTTRGPLRTHTVYGLR